MPDTRLRIPRDERTVRELQHLRMAWELLEDRRRGAFERASLRVLDVYQEHMALE